MSRKKLFKTLFFIMVAAILVASVYNIFSFFTTGKQAITVKTSSTYYSGTDISATIDVKKVKSNKDLNAKIVAELFDKDEKKVKDVETSGRIENGEEIDLLLNLPEDLETGKYILKVTSKSGILKDTAELDINIIKDTKSNVVISLDKGIYKPGDEINFRALLLSKKENTPVENDVSIYIYDGNDNKVYSNKTKTSEYGIVSGSFKLADEVNSGTYKLSIVTESQEVTKNFTVNPYVTPKFEATVTTDKENYLVGETAEITISGKYFFGEPVKGAEVKGTIDDKEIVGLTDEDGNFKTTYKLEESKKINMEFDMIDSSNYMIETSKTITVGTDIFEVEVLPEYSFIADGVDNEIYIITKNIDGTPIKTYSTVSINNITKQVISDENGIGKIILTKNEIDSLNVKKEATINLSAEDMEGNKIQKEVNLEVNSNYGVIFKTDKVKYNAEDDIEISIDSKNDLQNKTVYILKNNELVKTVSTEEDSVIVNLGNVTGLVDIIIPNEQKRSYYSGIVTFSRITNTTNQSNYARKTIFIKPTEKLNIDIKTSKEEYKPGDNLEVNFTTTNERNEKVDSALLVSILDEAILSLAENDLSIDNIKLALEDVVLTDGMTAADLYAIVLDDSNETALQSILLGQPINNLNLINKTYTSGNSSEYLAAGLMLLAAAILLVSARAIIKSEKVRNAVVKIIVPTINVVAIFAFLGLYLSDFIYDYVDVPDFAIILIELVLAIIVYVLYLYKEKDLILKMIKEFAIYPGIVVAIVNIVIELIYGVSDFRYSQISSVVIVISVLAFFILFTILKVSKRKNELRGIKEAIYEFQCALIRGAIFWVVLGILEPMFDEYALLIAVIIYILYRKIILKETHTKMKDGKIILNINSSEIVGMAIGVGMIFAVMIILAIYLSGQTSSSRIEDSMQTTGSIDVMGTLSPNSSSSSSNSQVKESSSSLIFDVDSYDGVTSESSSNGRIFDFATFSSDVKSDESITIESESIQDVEKDSKTQENIRNIFLESLAFIPELVTDEGKAELKLEISDNITTWNIQTVGNTKDGNVGYGNASFKVFKEFFVDFSLPTNSVVTDNVSIPVTLYNYTENELKINVNVKDNDWANIGEYEKIVSVPANETKMIYFPLEIIKDGNNTLRIETLSGDVSDIVEKTMVVKPNGLEINKVVSSGIIENNYSQDLIFDEDYIAGTENIKIKLYSSPISQAIENIDAILKMPTGCFEQTSSSLYPDILVLKYLRQNNLNNKELEEKALEYISAGYQKILTYEVPGIPGGYSLYGSSPAEPVITAFGLMEIKELSNVYEVDESVINEMVEYLFSVQKSNGTFDYSSTYIGGSASTDKTAMNAYIIWALSEVCPKDVRLEDSISYLEKEFEHTTDSYTLALMANVFVNTDNKSLANDVIDVLKEKVQTTEEGSYVVSTIRDYYGTKGKYQNIQATALASMALTKLNSNQKTNSEFIKYIQSQRDHRGSWGTTQSTILALKAITDYTSNSDLKNQTIVVSLNGEEKKVEVGDDSLGVYEFDFKNIEKENKFAIEIKKGKLTYEVIKNYYQEYDKLEMTENLVVTQELTSQTNVNGIITQKINVKNNYDYIENGLVEINIPQGCSVIEDSLLTLEYNKIIEKYEYNYGKINIYLRTFKQGEEVNLDIEYRASYPENITGGAIRVFDYYNPDVQGICEPKNIQVTK